VGGRRWPRRLLLREWAGEPVFPFSSRPLTLPPLFLSRSVYRLLSRLARVVGLWHDDGDPQSLVRFSWRPTLVLVERLSFASVPPGAPPDATPLTNLGSWEVGSSVADVIDASRCVLSQRRPARRHPLPGSSPAAEAAAAVAVGSFDAELGSSPSGSFESEMLRFFRGRVGGDPRARRRARARSAVPVTHLTRIPTPAISGRPPSPLAADAPRARRLAGLWRGAPPSDGGEPPILLLSYDTAGPAARVTATRVAGGASPAGGAAWTAAAAPLVEPWPVEDAALVGLRWLLAGGGDDHQRGGGGAPPAHAREVVAIHRARSAPAAGGARADARLWRYADGGLAFVTLPASAGAEGAPEAVEEFEPVPGEHVGW